MMYIIRVFVALFAVRRESEPLRCLVVARDVVAVVFALRKLAYERSVLVVKIEVTPAVALRPMDKLIPLFMKYGFFTSRYTLERSSTSVCVSPLTRTATRSMRFRSRLDRLM